MKKGRASLKAKPSVVPFSPASVSLEATPTLIYCPATTQIAFSEFHTAYTIRSGRDFESHLSYI
ncbi:MAG: hypothetical protein K9H62_23830 [Bacteroidales bacterium]|nr:hypothetical protein [Bacteroidales bacterium]